jgi:predicted SAM-dependent methyltransferase
MGYPHKFKKLYLIDLPSEDRCDMYKEIIIDPNCDGGEVVIKYGDMTELGTFADESVNFVWSGQSIEHVPLDAGRKMCQAAYRVLKAGGALCLDTSNRLMTKIHTHDIGGGFIHPEHCIEYEPAQLRVLLEEAGFVVEKVLDVCEIPTSSQSGIFYYTDFIHGEQITENVEKSYIQYFHCVKPFNP